jgi:pimeloyl-ACP methyl ester carboxylesterase
LTLGKKLAWSTFVSLAVLGAGFWLRPVSFFNEFLYLSDRLQGVKNLEIVVAGNRIHYEVEGPPDGPPVLLVHGLGGRAEDWRNLAPYLAKAGFRVYLPDLPGYGRSARPADFSYSVHDEAIALLQLMDALHLRQVDLGGWSMGGAIVQHLAADHPDRVRRLMLFDSAGLYVLPSWDVRLFTPTTFTQVDQLDSLLLPKPPPIPRFLARDIIRVSNNRAWVIHRALASMLTGKDATDKLLPSLKMPVLLIWGEQDRIMPLSQAQTMHALVPQSELDIFPGCGHLAPGQCAAPIAPEVIDFLKR